MNIIEARNITRMFPVGDGEFYALKHVDIDIPAGKLTILKGRSGSGKTTLMNILSALDAPTEGDVSFDGQVYSEMEDAQKEQLRRKEIGFVFQAVALIPIMNAYENVDFAMRLAEPELTAKEVDERIRRHLPWSEWKSVCGICRDRCPVESNSGSQSRGQWHTDRRLCLQMNRPERWIPSLDFGSCSCSET